MKHLKKMIAPIIITAITVVYLIVFAGFFLFTVGIPLWIKITGALLWFFFAGMSIFVFIERIKEIRSGEEDDLSQY